MKKKKIIAFYDLLVYIIICGSLIVWGCICLVIILVTDSPNYMQWALEHWYYAVSLGLGIAIPAVGRFFIKYCEFSCGGEVYFWYFPFTSSWKKAANGIDPSWNQSIYKEEIVWVELIKLTKEEKKILTSTKFLFNKYLCIKLQSGKEKYVYVATYAPWQIKRICSILLEK